MSPYPYTTSYSTSTYSTTVEDVDPQLWNWFSAADTNRSGAINAHELKHALMNANYTSFDDDTIKLLMNLFDINRSGTIGFNEYQGLWKYIRDWHNAFKYFDKDRSGTIDVGEMAEALRKFGYNLTPQLIILIQKKYAPLTYRGGHPPGINFDRFVRACVTVKQLTETFRRLDIDHDGWIQIDYDQFLFEVLNLP